MQTAEGASCIRYSQELAASESGEGYPEEYRCHDEPFGPVSIHFAFRARRIEISGEAGRRGFLRASIARITICAKAEIFRVRRCQAAANSEIGESVAESARFLLNHRAVL